MPKLNYIGPKSFGHIVYGPVTRKPYRVHPGTPTQIVKADVAALLDGDEWEEIKAKSTGKVGPDQSPTEAQAQEDQEV